jgi:hypothetical protein
MKTPTHYFRFLAISALFVAGLAHGADKELHVRGEITGISATAVTVKERGGETVNLGLPPKYDVMEVSRTTLAGVSENSYIGVAAAPLGPDKVRALGLLVFPEGARGLNEGFFPWDLKKNSTMTNATVAKLVKVAGTGGEIQVRYDDRTQTVIIDGATTIGQFVPATPALLIVGAKLFVVASQADGAAAVGHLFLVGKDGFLPPF